MLVNKRLITKTKQKKRTFTSITNTFYTFVSSKKISYLHYLKYDKPKIKQAKAIEHDFHLIIYKENNLIMYRKDSIHFLHAMPMFKFTG